MAMGTRFEQVEDRPLIPGTEPAPVADKTEKGADRHPFRTGFIVGAIITVAMTLLIIQNGETVKFEWFVLDLEWPLWVLLLVSFVAGMVAWQLFLHEIRRLHKASGKRRTRAGRTARGNS